MYSSGSTRTPVFEQALVNAAEMPGAEIPVVGEHVSFLVVSRRREPVDDLREIAVADLIGGQKGVFLPIEALL